MFTTAAEIRKWIKEETQCDQGFINHLRKWGVIEKLKRARLSGNKDMERDIWNEDVVQGYRDYCTAWGLDCRSINQDNKN